MARLLAVRPLALAHDRPIASPRPAVVPPAGSFKPRAGVNGGEKPRINGASSLSVRHGLAMPRSERQAPSPGVSIVPGRQPPVIGIGGHLAMPPLPHHRAYGSVPRRFGGSCFDEVGHGDQAEGAEASSC